MGLRSTLGIEESSGFPAQWRVSAAAAAAAVGE
jgi:hypothetical protein